MQDLAAEPCQGSRPMTDPASQIPAHVAMFRR